MIGCQVDFSRLYQFLGQLGTSRNFSVKVLYCGQTTSWSSKHCFPNFSEKLCGTDYFFRLCQDYFYLFQQIGVLIFKCW